MARALKLIPAMSSGQALMAPIGPPLAASAPRNGIVCSKMMIMPMPDMNPEITEYGVKDTRRPIRITPRRIWVRPAMMTMVNAWARLSAFRVTMTAIATAIGPVGPDIWDLVRPNTAAKKPTAMAP